MKVSVGNRWDFQETSPSPRALEKYCSAPVVTSSGVYRSRWHRSCRGPAGKVGTWHRQPSPGRPSGISQHSCLRRIQSLCFKTFLVLEIIFMWNHLTCKYWSQYFRKDFTEANLNLPVAKCSLQAAKFCTTQIESSPCITALPWEGKEEAPSSEVLSI